MLSAVFCVAQNERLSDGKRFLTVPPQRAYSSDIGPEWELDPAEIDWRKSVLIGKVRHLLLSRALQALVSTGHSLCVQEEESLKKAREGFF